MQSSRKRMQRGMLLLMVVLVLPGFAAAVDAAVPGLELVDQPLPESPALPAIDLEAPGAGTSAKWLLFLRQTGTTELPDVELFTNVMDPQVMIAAEGAQAKKVTVPKAGGAAVRVTFTVSGVGNQPSTIGKIFAKVGDEIQEVAALTVRNRLNRPSVTFDSLAAASGDIDWFGGKKDVDVRASIKETGGQKLKFTSMELVNFSRKWKTNRVQAIYRGVEFKKELEDNEPPAPEDNDLPPLDLEPNQTIPFIVAIEGLEAPGEYEGTVRLSAQHLEAVESTLSVTLRYRWWVAALLIGIGVIVAQQLRWWLTVRRRQLTAQRRVAALRGELDRVVSELTQVSSAEEEVVATLRQRLQDLFAKASAGEDIAAQAAVIEIKLPVVSRWIRLRQQIDDAGGDAALLGELLPVGHWLRRPSGTEQEQNTQLSALDATELKLPRLPEAQIATTRKLGDAPEVSAPSTRELSWRIWLGEGLVTLVLLIVSIALGLEVLYFDSLAWGAPHDLLVAVLWGLGLHTVGGSAFGGSPACGRPTEADDGESGTCRPKSRSGVGRILPKGYGRSHHGVLSQRDRPSGRDQVLHAVRRPPRRRVSGLRCRCRWSQDLGSAQRLSQNTCWLRLPGGDGPPGKSECTMSPARPPPRGSGRAVRRTSDRTSGRRPAAARTSTGDCRRDP